MTQKCLRKNCGETLWHVGFGSMGAYHSNYYMCYNCGNVYLIYDNDAFPPRLVTKGFKCGHQENRGTKNRCSELSCPFTYREAEWEKIKEDCKFKRNWRKRNFK
jgi:hypothetical protein